MFEFHPSMLPGAIIGYRRNGTPIRLLAGGSGEGEGDTTSTDDTGASADTSEGDDTGHDGDAGGTGGRASTSTGQDDTPKVIAALRNDFKSERGKRQAAEKELTDVKKAQAQLQEALNADKAERDKQMDLIAKAMGLKPTDEPPTPEKLAQQLADAQRSAQAEVTAREAAEARAQEAVSQAKRERALMLVAGSHEANAAALLDSRSFMDKIGRLDPAADAFAEQLSEAIKAAVEANGAYKLTPKRTAPAQKSSGGEFNGSAGGDRQWTDEDVDKASPEELREAMDKGLLRDLGFGPSRKRAWRR